MLGILYADQVFRTTVEAKGEGLDPAKHVYAPPTSNLLLTVPRRLRFISVTRCYVRACVYGLQQYGHLNNKWPLCFLFSSVLLFKIQIGKTDITAVSVRVAD